MTTDDQSSEMFRLLTGPSECPYLPEQQMQLDYGIDTEMPAERFEEMLSRGWRKQGASFFRPACASCRQCVSVRIPVNDFRPSKSQRKAIKRNPDVRLEVQPASVSEDHARIYQAYHDDMHERRGWPVSQFNAFNYASAFLAGDHGFTYDFLYYRESELIGVGIVDVLPNALSSVYFFHDPAWRSASPGTFTVQQEIEYARQTDRDWVYLGYWVEGCQSMTYKSRFQPQERLNGYPDSESDAVWESTKRPVTDARDDRDSDES